MMNEEILGNLQEASTLMEHRPEGFDLAPVNDFLSSAGHFINEYYGCCHMIDNVTPIGIGA